MTSGLSRFNVTIVFSPFYYIDFWDGNSTTHFFQKFPHGIFFYHHGKISGWSELREDLYVGITNEVHWMLYSPRALLLI